MRLATPCLSVTLVFATTAPSQTAIVVPDGLATVPGNANNSFPWSRNASSMRIQFIYDDSHFTAQGMTGPALITQLRWRPYSPTTTPGTWAGGSWPNVRIDLATAATSWSAPSATFANNLGADAITVHQGPVVVIGGTVQPNTVGPWYIGIPLATPFVYNPATGDDLLVDIHLDGTGWTGTSRAADHQWTGSMAARIYNTSGLTATTGSVGTSYGAVMEVTHQPAVGVFSRFSATPRTGPSPLQVQFADASFTSDPNGILAWAWDVDGDNVVDYTVQNPSHTYTNCGTYSVSLTVIAANGTNTLAVSNFIVTDTVTPSFAWSNLGANVIQYTDTSAPVPTSWDWDLDGDGITDSTAQHPVWAYAQTQCVGANVRLAVSRLCRGPFTTSQQVVLAPSSVAYMTGSTSTSSSSWIGGLFDVSVTHPGGISVCGVTVRPGGLVAPMNVAVYVAPDTYVGKDTNASLWRLVATATALPAAAPGSIALNPPFYLPAGNFGMAVYIGQPGGVSTSMTHNSVPTTGHPGPISTPDVILFPNPAAAPGMIRTGLFGGGTLNPRIWNGTLHYSACGTGGDPGFGFFGAGCAGSLGITNLRHAGRPRIGSTLTVNYDNLPLAAAIIFMGFSNTNSLFGPLPLDLGVYGAPGCSARVSTDATLFLLGAGNAAAWNFGIPNVANLVGVLMYHQALVLDPGFNTFGAVMSDAAGLIIGS
ncbi:MAG: PKD domain-containing protein [Planctomycetes bacterium]|nr:PKD domain-containing protein [Planctomycetota bacterium]